MLGYVGPFAGRVFGLCIAIGAMALGDNLETFGKFARLKTVAPSKSPMNVNPKIFLGALMCSQALVTYTFAFCNVYHNLEILTFTYTMDNNAIDGVCMRIL